MTDKDFVPFIKSNKIERKIKQIAKILDQKYGDEEVCLVCVLKGAVVFYSQLLKHLKNKNIELDFVEVKSYSGTSSTGKVKMVKDATIEIKDKHLVLVEDIIDTGLTAKFMCEHFKKQNPKSILMCSLLQKPEKLSVELDMETLVAFNIPNKFIIGYGLDLDEKYRNLKDILILKEK
ncbi:MAG: hypoxanthine phosphoribosyltransferase [Clostridia bacterium]|nr:hypoxanthine phosphoribosyltransferase [Clostridia bacterium]